MRDLFFRIKAADATGAAFAKVKANLRGVEGAVASANERVKRFGAGLATAGAAWTGVGASLGLAFSGSLQAWDDAEKAQTAVAQAIRSTGGAAGFTAEQLGEMAAGFQRATRFDGDQVLGDMTAQLLTFTNVTGDAFARAQQSILDISTVMKTDLKGTAIQVGKALNDPIKGLAGLGRAGIQFSEDQKATIKALVETGEIAQAQGLILDELARQYGGQAEAAAAAGLGFVDQFRNAWGDLQESVGGVLAEVARPLVAIMQTVVGAFTGLPESMQKFIVLFGLAAVAIGPVVAGLGVLVAVMGAASLPALAIGAAIAALGAALVTFWPQIEATIGWFKNAWTEMSLFEKAFAPISLALRAMADTFIAVFPETAAAVAKAVEEIKQWLTEGLRAAFDWVVGKVEWVGDAFARLYDRVVGHSYVPDMVAEVGLEFGKLQGNMVDPTTAATETVGGRFQDLASGVGAAIGGMIREGDLSFRGFADRMLDTANQMADGIVNDAFRRIAEAAQGLGTGGAGGGGGIAGFFGKVLGGLFGGGGGLPGFANGGDFEVGGKGGIDRNVAVMRVSKGERVSVARRGDPRGSAPVIVNISTPNPAAFEASRGQVAATISRAVSRGSRNL